MAQPKHEQDFTEFKVSDKDSEPDEESGDLRPLTGLDRINAFLYNKPDLSRDRLHKSFPISLGLQDIRGVYQEELGRVRSSGGLRGFWAEDVLLKSGIVEEDIKKAGGNILSLIELLKEKGWTLSEQPQPGALVVHPDAPTRDLLSSTAFVGKDVSKRVYLDNFKVREIEVDANGSVQKASGYVQDRDRKFFKIAKYMIPPKK